MKEITERQLNSARKSIHKYFDCEEMDDSDADIAERLIDDINAGEIDQILEIMDAYSNHQFEEMGEF